MNKRLSKALLFGTLLLASTSVFVSCKDYDDDINSLQAQIDQKADKTALEQAKATLEQEKAALEQDKANLQQSVTTLTAERDNYKAKYENKPADVPAVNGKDAKLDEQSIEDYVKNNPVYQQTFEENL